MLIFLYINELGQVFHFDHELKLPEIESYEDILGTLSFKGTYSIGLGA